MSLPEGLAASGPARLSPWHPRGLLNAFDNLSPEVKQKWIWWNLPTPATRNIVFSDFIEANPIGVEWRTASETAKLLRMMSEINRQKLNEAKTSGRRMVGTIYRRTRIDEVGRKAQRAEIISPRETARLMGLSDDYELPTNYNKAYHLTGDGVAVPVVRHLAAHIFEPLLAPSRAMTRAAA
jgi:DNA (cytosine-5)-methyltransferase 1